MNDLVIGGMPQERKTLNLGDYAEEAVLITEEEPAKQKRPLFVESRMGQQQKVACNNNDLSLICR